MKALHCTHMYMFMQLRPAVRMQLPHCHARKKKRNTRSYPTRPKDIPLENLKNTKQTNLFERRGSNSDQASHIPPERQPLSLSGISSPTPK